ncbi:MAG TPA: hypothetical protein VHQ47_08850 [Phycisphaerae bacterium]|nr:hypothetical protein [Phycisphaerae bacterium]HVV70156.1 hypothetical protein [Verrucomicrobiae bacterium]
MNALPLHPDDIADLRRIIAKVDGLRGDGVSNTRDSISIVAPRVRPYYPAQTAEIFDATITAKSAINGAIQFSYSIKLGHWDMTTNTSNGGTWVDDSGGTAVTAFNEAESMNTFTSGTGDIGTGNTNVTQSDGTINGGSCKLVPLAVGDYVTVKRRGVDSSGVLYFTIINKSNSAQ